ncbi:MAG TPA: MupA/Atu3671 family FMN-dependent luciferase-like monooxygenase, partial [Thermoanaerobaculia bacterium]|nr:MupA/Atu3671 family FMN-dependent luciferase-like monooxygenase [Thermoanaerobaculia bacterium]
GHSLGEYVAATLAGVFTLDAAVRVVAARGQLMAHCAPGRMLAVATGETTVRALLPHDLALASVNAPAQCVVSGPADAVFRFEALVRERGIDARPLATSHAFHSPMMTGAADALASAIGDARPAAPSVRFISSLTGTWITPEQATSARYWRDQLLGTVRFADGLSTLAADRALVLLDAGPRQTAARLARQTAGRTARIPLPPLRQWAADGERDRDYFLESLGALWCEGMDVDWSATYRAERRARVALPGYAFERKRYWVEPSQPPAAATTPRETSESRIEQNFFEIAWNESAPPAHGEQPRVVVVLEDEAGAGRAIADRLSGVEVIRESASSASFDRLIESLQPGRVAFVHCGALDGGASFEEAQNRGYHSVIALAKAIARRWSGHDSSLRVVTRGAWDVVASDRVDAAAATVFGPIKVLSQEYPNIAAQAIDVDAEAGAREIADAVAAELAAPPAVSLVAWRDGKRYERTPRRTSVPRERAPIRRGGHYFITGGLGQFGLILAEHLVTVRGARVTLLSRRPLPPRGEWAAIRRREARDAAAAAIHRLARLLDAGDGVLVVQGDVADRARLEAAVIAAEERFGAIHGVIHAAGVTGVEHFKTIAETGPADAALHFAAKAHGLLAIESVFAPRSPDFVMAVSSLSPILGGLGFSAYAAANIFMDAFVRARRKAGDDAYLTVNWEGWLPQHEEGHLLFGRQQIERMMSDDEIADVFERAVAARRVQVISATDDLVVREREWSTLGRAAIASSAASDDTTEAAMLRVWREVLGLDDLDADSNFYAVGGSSLSAMQIIARLRARLHIDLPLESFLTAQTPRALAALIDGRHAPEAAASLAPAAVEDILAEIEALDAEPPRRAASSDPSFGETPLDLSIIFFSGDATPSGNGGKYDLLLASAQLADTLGFSAVWLPERHFQKFGGLYPNPSVLGATVAAKTARIGIRAGSVVLPLHDPIRVAEEWSVVDNLSGGRVALSFAAGWHPNDFVFAPGSYADRRKAMFRDIDVVRRLWRGESVERALPDGSRAAVAILPRPLQAELPVWVTAESSETFVAAGEIGANILTGLINQTKDELAGRIALWRKALEEHGHDPGTRRVTLMLHTYVTHDARRVDERARPSLTRYLGEFLSQNTRMMAALAGVDPRSLTEADRATLVRLAVDRYIASNSLIGTPEHCLDVLEEVRRAGVGEIATLLDFGIAAEDVLSSLELLGEVAGQEKRSALMRP